MEKSYQIDNHENVYQIDNIVSEVFYYDYELPDRKVLDMIWGRPVEAFVRIHLRPISRSICQNVRLPPLRRATVEC